ncbi:MAG: acetate kinase [Clostridia bacterium]|nr:acetate kinase [Clostridia bacterium]
MKVLVINCGSSSLKYQLINMENEEVLAKGNYERIGQGNSFLTHKVNGEKYVLENPVDNHEQALEFMIEQLLSDKYGVISSLDEISAVGHRVPHGTDLFDKSVLITDEIKDLIASCTDLAPIHTPPILNGIKACEKVIPGKPMVAVFDTAFHQTISKEKYIYPVPYEYFEKYNMRKFGFHGTSHRFVSQRLAELMNKDVKDLKIVVCHLGQGASLCGVKDGKSVDTSMGFTPVSGIMMCARSGDLDPSVVTFLMKKEGFTPDEMENVLNKKSGVLGISGVSPDFRDIEKEADEGNQRAKLAREAYCYNVAQYIAKYAVALNGVDAIAFTAGIGENQINIRKRICEHLEWMGVKLDLEANQSRGEDKEISTPDSKVKVWVVPTNEELVIARDTKQIVENL